MDLIKTNMCGINAYLIELTGDRLISESSNSKIFKISRKIDNKNFALKIFKKKMDAYQKVDFTKFLKALPSDF